MHRGVIEACLPCLIALAVLFLLGWGVVRLSGARLRLGRLAELHRCQEGGVQTLSFVITLPVFLMILLFIVQVSQLMIALMTVNYAAYAAARSASVWIPAELGLPTGSVIEPQNVLPPGIVPNQPFRVDAAVALTSPKYSKIFDAATLACAPIAPSRDLASIDPGLLGATQADDAAIATYCALVPASSSNARLPRRLQNKIAYSRQNTLLFITFIDKNSGVTSGSTQGPTYNPPDLPPETPPLGYAHIHNDSEVGWQDPVTVEVEHHFALLPGPGRFLSKLLIRADGRPDTVSPQIFEENGVHKTAIFASATMTVEGLKSVYPYPQPSW